MKIVGQLKAILGLDKSKYDKGLKSAEKTTSKFGGTIAKVGGLIGGAFAVSKIKDFLAESSKLAAEAEGIRQAYSKIDGTNIESLRKSVKGTVSDMELMRNTVVATTLGLKASKMPELFAFAAQRANETGESVQFLVDSIVKGIGRKSPLILDNLGISAIALKEAMGGLSLEAASVADVTEAVAKIARETTGGIDDLGNAALTTAQKTQQLQAETTNLKVALGDIVNEIVGQLAPALTNFTAQATRELTDLATVVGSDNVPKWEKFAAVLMLVQGGGKGVSNVAESIKDNIKEIPPGLARVNELMEKFNKLINDKKVKSAPKTIGWYKEQVKELKGSLDAKLPSDKAEIAEIWNKIRAYEKLIGLSGDIRDVGSDTTISKVDAIEPPTFETGDILSKYDTLEQKATDYSDLESQIRAKQAQEDLIRRDQHIANADMVASYTMNLLNAVSNLYESQKNKEIELARRSAQQQGKSAEWLAKEEDKINKKYAKKQKNIAIAMAIINTAVGVTKALNMGGPLGIITGALVAAAGATEIATISSQGMKRGGVVPGGYPNDSYPAMLTSGETVVPPNKLPSMMGGGGELSTRVSGRDIEIVLNRWSKDKSRIS